MKITTYTQKGKPQYNIADSIRQQRSHHELSRRVRQGLNVERSGKTSVKTSESSGNEDARGCRSRNAGVGGRRGGGGAPGAVATAGTHVAADAVGDADAGNGATDAAGEITPAAGDNIDTENTNKMTFVMVFFLHSPTTLNIL